MATETPKTTREIPDFPIPRPTGCPFDPPTTIRVLHRSGSASRVRIWDGSTPWLITGYEDQRTLLADRRVSANTRHPGYPHVSAGVQAQAETTTSFMGTDGPQHARARRMLAGPFTTRRVEALRPMVQRIVDGLIDDLLGGPRPVDLVEEFAVPVPSMVICEMLGVPYADRHVFQTCSRTIINRESSVQEVLDAQSRLLGYLVDLIGRKSTDPSDDMLSRMAAEQVVTGAVEADELASMMLLLLIAGHESTANLIALGVLALLGHPEQLDAVRETVDAAELTQAAEELLRYPPIIPGGLRRVAIEDIPLGSVTIRAGEGLIFSTDTGNRDDREFPAADRLDVRRAAPRNLAFGHGPHQCPGQSLARLELQVVHGTLYRRIPGLRLAIEPSEVLFKNDGLVYGVYHLPVTW